MIAGRHLLLLRLRHAHSRAASGNCLTICHSQPSCSSAIAPLIDRSAERLQLMDRSEQVDVLWDSRNVKSLAAGLLYPNNRATGLPQHFRSNHRIFQRIISVPSIASFDNVHFLIGTGSSAETFDSPITKIDAPCRRLPNGLHIASRGVSLAKKLPKSYPGQNIALSPSTVYFSRDESVEKQKSSPPAEKFPQGKPNWTQLNHVALRLSDTLPHIFSTRMDFTFYHPEVHLIDRISGREIRKVWNLMIYAGTIRTFFALRYVHASLIVIDIAPVESDALVRVRYRIVTVKAIESALLMYRHFKERKGQSWYDFFERFGTWRDGVAVCHVNDRGQVYKVIIDKLEPNRQNQEAMDVDWKKKLAKRVVPAGV